MLLTPASAKDAFCALLSSQHESIASEEWKSALSRREEAFKLAVASISATKRRASERFVEDVGVEQQQQESSAVIKRPRLVTMSKDEAFDSIKQGVDALSSTHAADLPGWVLSELSAIKQQIEHIQESLMCPD